MTPWEALTELRNNKSLSEEQIFNLECILATNPEMSWGYAKDNNKRFLLGEVVISMHTWTSYYYTIDILKRPFQLGEEAMSKDPFYSCDYAKNILKGRFPLGEEAISKDHHCSFRYAMEVVKGKFEAGEKAISECPKAYYAYHKMAYDETSSTKNRILQYIFKFLAWLGFKNLK